MKREKIAPKLRPAFDYDYYSAVRMPGENFGDFCNRVGIEALREAGLTVAV